MLKGFTKEEKSWMMYDWANSAHSVIIVTLLEVANGLKLSTTTMRYGSSGFDIGILRCRFIQYIFLESSAAVFRLFLKI